MGKRFGMTTDWSEVPSSRLASCRRAVLLGARASMCFSLAYSTVPPLARSLWKFQVKRRVMSAVPL